MSEGTKSNSTETASEPWDEEILLFLNLQFFTVWTTGIKSVSVNYLNSSQDIQERYPYACKSQEKKEAL